MTGAYLRVQRDGKWHNFEVEHLTDAERQEKLGNSPRLIDWLNLVCAKLAETEVLFNELVAEGVLTKAPAEIGKGSE